MAFLPEALTPEEVKRTPVAKIRAEYNKLADYYGKIMDKEIMFCSSCGEPMNRYAFYTDKRYISGYNPMCKECISKIVEQRKTKRDEPNITKESFKKGLMILDKPFINSLWRSSLEEAKSEGLERNKRGVWSSYITQVSSLPQQKNKTQIHSEVDEDDTEDNTSSMQVNENNKIVKAGRKRFGDEYSPQDLYFLESQYEDFLTRYEINLKSQEILVEEIVFKQLELKEARMRHKETSKLLRDLQDLMTSLNIKPSQSNSDQLTDAKSFGQLIDIQEKEQPIPEPEGPFKDIDHIGMLVDGFFRGHLVKMMGLKNAWSQIYDKLMDKYTVKVFSEVEDEEDEDVLNRMFGAELDKENING